jgi:alpha/beta superfamily hydrolase
MPLLWSSDSLTVETVYFQSAGYRVEGELAYADSPPLGGVVIAGPHPLLGGNKKNNIVRALGDGLAARGFVTLRFDYKGVGGSEGPAMDTAAHLAAFWETSQAPDDPERANDLRDAVAYLRGVIGPTLPLALVGYSFGCTLLPAAISEGDTATPLVLVGPTLGRHDYTPYETLPHRKLIIAAEDDFASDERGLSAWFSRLSAPKGLVQGHLDGHFFRGHEDWLVATVSSFLKDVGRTGHDADAPSSGDSANRTG